MVLRDQDTFVLGGIIDERVEHTVHKVPVLGDIPVLGFLFRRDIKESFRREIVVIVKPYVIGN